MYIPRYELMTVWEQWTLQLDQVLIPSWVWVSVVMGGRQSQEPDQPSLDSITPPPHRHSSHPLPSHHHLHQRPSSHTRSSPPPLPTLSEYTNLRPVRRPHSHSTGSRPPELPAPHTRTSAEDQFLELNIALSALQRRLQARAEGQDGPHHHHYPLSAGLPLLLFRPPPSKTVC